MTRPSDAYALHNALVAPLVRALVKPVVARGGDSADILVLLVSVAAGVLHMIERVNRDTVDVAGLGEDIARRRDEIREKAKASTAMTRPLELPDSAPTPDPDCARARLCFLRNGTAALDHVFRCAGCKLVPEAALRAYMMRMNPPEAVPPPAPPVAVPAPGAVFPTDDASPEIVLAAVVESVLSWSPDDRVIGAIRAADIVRALDTLHKEIAEWRACASYDPDMSGRARFKGWDRSALDRCRRTYIEQA